MSETDVGSMAVEVELSHHNSFFTLLLIAAEQQFWQNDM